MEKHIALISLGVGGGVLLFFVDFSDKSCAKRCIVLSFWVVLFLKKLKSTVLISLRFVLLLLFLLLFSILKICCACVQYRGLILKFLNHIFSYILLLAILV